jgi:hypothetical protein
MFGAAGLLAVILAIAAILIVRAAQSSNGSSLDPGLKSTADRFLPQLNRAHGKLPIPDSTLRSFQAWVYDSQTTFARLVTSERGPRIVQLLFDDPNTSPPQSPLLSAPGRPGILLDPSALSQVVKSHQPAYFTEPEKSAPDLRVYVVPLTTPAPLRASNCVGLLEVIQIT